MRTHTILAAALVAATSISIVTSIASAATTTATSASKTVFQMKDLSGQPLTVPSPSSKATVLFFVSKDCPYSNAASPEMSRIAGLYEKKGFNFVFVYASPYAKASESAAHAKSYNFDAPAVLDPGEKLTQASGATNTPEAVVISPSGKFLYKGRVDNRFDAVGVQRTVVTQHDLVDALDAISAGKAPAHAFQRPIGCTIPPVPQS